MLEDIKQISQMLESMRNKYQQIDLLLSNVYKIRNEFFEKKQKMLTQQQYEALKEAEINYHNSSSQYNKSYIEYLKHFEK